MFCTYPIYLLHQQKINSQEDSTPIDTASSIILMLATAIQGEKKYNHIEECIIYADEREMLALNIKRYEDEAIQMRGIILFWSKLISTGN